MKSFRCQLCKKVCGSRHKVRKHIREYHGVKGKPLDPIGGKQKYLPSDITKNCVGEEI